MAYDRENIKQINLNLFYDSGGEDKANISMTAAPPTMEVQNWPIDRLIPYARNPHKNDDVVDRMCASIREFGFKIPILARTTGEICDGHLRWKAAKKLRMSEVPVILCDEWTDAQVKAFRLLVNRSATWADWDDELGWNFRN